MKREATAKYEEKIKQCNSIVKLGKASISVNMGNIQYYVFCNHHKKKQQQKLQEGKLKLYIKP